MVNETNRNPKISKAPLKIQAQSTILFTGAAMNQKVVVNGKLKSDFQRTFHSVGHDNILHIFYFH